jgi:hypothetical protein
VNCYTAQPLLHVDEIAALRERIAKGAAMVTDLTLEERKSWQEPDFKDQLDWADLPSFKPLRKASSASVEPQSAHQVDWASLPCFKPVAKAGRAAPESALLTSQTKASQNREHVPEPSLHLTSKVLETKKPPQLVQNRARMFLAPVSISLSALLILYVIVGSHEPFRTVADTGAVEVQPMPHLTAGSVRLEKAPSQPPAQDIRVTQLHPPFDPAAIDALLDGGHASMQSGDIANARLMFQRAAALGSSRGALMVGQTYDTNALKHVTRASNWKDEAQAELWYKRAAALGEFAGEVSMRRLELSRLIDEKMPAD